MNGTSCLNNSDGCNKILLKTAVHQVENMRRGACLLLLTLENCSADDPVSTTANHCTYIVFKNHNLRTFYTSDRQTHPESFFSLGDHGQKCVHGFGVLEQWAGSGHIHKTRAHGYTDFFLDAAIINAYFLLYQLPKRVKPSYLWFRRRICHQFTFSFMKERERSRTLNVCSFQTVDVNTSDFFNLFAVHQ